MGGVTGNLRSNDVSDALLCSVRSRSESFFGTDLVSKTLGGDNSDLIADSLVGLKVEGELRVVAFDDDLRRLLDGLDNVSLISDNNGFG